MLFRFKCDMLVDQCRHVGNDPVGYKCSSDASYEHILGFLFCEGCKEIFEKNPERLTFPSIYGKLYQTNLIKEIVDVWNKNHTEDEL